MKSTVLVYVLVLAIFSGCGSVGRRRARQEEPPPPPPATEAAQPVPVKEEPKTEQPPQEMAINLKKDEVFHEATQPKSHQRVIGSVEWS